MSIIKSTQFKLTFQETIGLLPVGRPFHRLTKLELPFRNQYRFDVDDREKVNRALMQCQFQQNPDSSGPERIFAESNQNYLCNSFQLFT